MPSKLGMEGLKKGLITQKQYDNLPEKLLDAIVTKKMKDMPKSKPMKKKPAKGKKGKKGKK